MINNYLQIYENARVMIIDGTLMAQHGILDNPLLKVFDKFIEGFPTLFIEGKKIGMANSKEEAIAFLRSYLYDDYIIPRVKLQEVECEYVKKWFGKKVLVCVGGEDDE